MRIAMPKGDIRYVRFLVFNLNGTAADIDFTEVTFSVKKTTKDELSLFQKTLSGHTISRLGPGDYQLKIFPEDTLDLYPGNYKFDVQLVFETQLKETFVGDYVIQDDYSSGYDTALNYIGVDATCIKKGNIHKLVISTPVAAGGGTYNYDDLENKPTINDVTIVGDLSLDDLGIQAANPDIPQAAISSLELQAIIDEVFGEGGG